MALTKSTTIPGFGAPVNYFRIDTVERCCEVRREAIFKLYAYATEALARSTGGRGYHHAGSFEFKEAAFDLYFSRSALSASAKKGISIHGQAYQAVKDYIAALNTDANARTPAQVTLATVGLIRIANDFGGPSFYSDAIDA